jgi:hypothetical protein
VVIGKRGSRGPVRVNSGFGTWVGTLCSREEVTAQTLRAVVKSEKRKSKLIERRVNDHA